MSELERIDQEAHFALLIHRYEYGKPGDFGPVTIGDREFVALSLKAGINPDRIKRVQNRIRGVDGVDAFVWGFRS